MLCLVRALAQVVWRALIKRQPLLRVAKSAPVVLIVRRWGYPQLPVNAQLASTHYLVRALAQVALQAHTHHHHRRRALSAVQADIKQAQNQAHARHVPRAHVVLQLVSPTSQARVRRERIHHRLRHHVQTVPLGHTRRESVHVYIALVVLIKQV